MEWCRSALIEVRSCVSHSLQWIILSPSWIDGLETGLCEMACRGEWNCVVSFIMLVAQSTVNQDMPVNLQLNHYFSILFNIHQYIVRHWLVLTTMESNCWANFKLLSCRTKLRDLPWRDLRTWGIMQQLSPLWSWISVLLSESTLWSPIWWIDRRLLCCSHRRAIHLPLICRVVAWLVARNTSSY